MRKFCILCAVRLGLLSQLVPDGRRNEHLERKLAPATKPSLGAGISAIAVSLGHRFQCARPRRRKIPGILGGVLALFGGGPRLLLAADDSVVVECPELDLEPAAELESRARATLLTSPLATGARIICEGGGARVIVTSAESSAEVKAEGQLPLREEVLKALDEALAQLNRANAGTSASETPSDVSAAPPPSASSPTPPAASAPSVDVPRMEPRAAEPARPPAPSQRWLGRGGELGVRAMAELWKDRLAMGGGASAAVNVAPALWCGLRAGAYGPLGVAEFGAVEVHAEIEGSWEIEALAGLRGSLAFGPSVLRISPPSDLSAKASTVRTAIRFEAQLSRPFRFDWLELSPWLGLRVFSAERGVRVSAEERLVLGSVLPSLGIAVAYRN